MNHCISKKIVAKAKALCLGIAVEDLGGIQDRVTVQHSQRSRHKNWSFAQLRGFLEYKAKLAGVPVVAVDPRGTSKTCSVCGHCDKGNRRSQSRFSCKACGHTAHADKNGAVNIRLRALGASVNSPELVAVAPHK